LKEEYSIVERTPATEEYGKLRTAAGWDEIDTQAAERGLNNSVYSVCAVHKGEAPVYGRAEYHKKMDSTDAELEPDRIAARSAFRRQAETGFGSLIESVGQQALTQFTEQSLCALLIEA
jgi:hypothetical protein